MLQNGVRLGFPFAEALEDPSQSRTLTTAERPPLFDEPREMDLEVSAGARVAGDIAEPPTELLGDVAAEVRPERAFPASEPPERDAKVVQRLVIGGFSEPVVSGDRVREVAEGHDADHSVGRFTKVVDARGHELEIVAGQQPPDRGDGDAPLNNVPSEG
jgi:hypothetical protein